MRGCIDKFCEWQGLFFEILKHSKLERRLTFKYCIVVILYKDPRRKYVANPIYTSVYA